MASTVSIVYGVFSNETSRRWQSPLTESFRRLFHFFQSPSVSIVDIYTSNPLRRKLSRKMWRKCGVWSLVWAFPVPSDSIRTEPIFWGQIWCETWLAISPAKLYLSPPSWKDPIPCKSTGVKKLAVQSLSFILAKLMHGINLQRGGCGGSRTGLLLALYMNLAARKTLRSPQAWFVPCVIRAYDLII